MGRSIGERRRRLDELKTNRQVKKDLKKIPKGFLLISIWISVFSLFTGLYIGSNNPAFMNDFNESITVDGYEFHFVSSEKDERMEGRLGYTLRTNHEDVWINSKLLRNSEVEQLKETCQHEMLHNLGIPSDNHEFVYRYDSQINEPVCDTLIKRLKT